MEDQQHDALLEELRKLRGEVRSLKQIVKSVLILLSMCVMVIAMKVPWFRDSLVGAALAAMLLMLVWIGKAGFLDWRDGRRRKTPARIVTTVFPKP